VKLKTFYIVEQKSARSKFYVVWKCHRQEFGNFKVHDTKLEIVSRDLTLDRAHAFCTRLNDEESRRNP
jgi:hypothetical protein